MLCAAGATSLSDTGDAMQASVTCGEAMPTPLLGLIGIILARQKENDLPVYTNNM